MYLDLNTGDLNMITNNNSSTISYHPYGSLLNITNIACYSSINITPCNDYISLTNNDSRCWTFSPFRVKSKQVCNDDDCIVSSKRYNRNNDNALDYIIFNITSDTSPVGPVSDYFSVTFNSVFIKDRDNE
ncbi:6469_t:CDS:1 [Cetraspora pellucida]|uniref:6469_t:CDS:1 n=1 Tax=Cetraspora pellucida TaxID=1433469 RepID=A0ACA9KHI7_9GLOM|nr:6469_t:CDS:1 [Cetraspora pellucida]